MRISTYILTFSLLVISLSSCNNKCYNPESIEYQSNIEFFALNREGIDKYNQEIRTLNIFSYNLNGALIQENESLIPDKLLYLGLPEGEYKINSFANLSDTVIYSTPLEEIRLKPSSQPNLYQPASNIFFGTVNSTKIEPFIQKRDSIYLNRAVGLITITLTNIPAIFTGKTGEFTLYGTTVGIDKNNQPLPESAVIHNIGTVAADGTLSIDIIAFPSIDSLKLNLTLLHPSNPSFNIVINSTLNEMITPNKKIWVEYKYNPKDGNTVQMHISIHDWEDTKTEEVTGL